MWRCGRHAPDRPERYLPLTKYMDRKGGQGIACLQISGRRGSVLDIWSGRFALPVFPLSREDQGHVDIQRLKLDVEEREGTAFSRGNGTCERASVEREGQDV